MTAPSGAGRRFLAQPLTRTGMALLLLVAAVTIVGHSGSHV